MTQPRQSSEWFVKDGQRVRGPISEADLRKIVRQSSNPDLLVKQGDSQWHAIADIRRKMDELAANGIFIRFHTVAEGPFTITKAHELLQTVNSDGIEVRTGHSGEWVPANAWLEAVARLQRKRQSGLQLVARSKHKQAESATPSSNSGREAIAAATPANGDRDDEIIRDAMAADEDQIVEAVLVEAEPQPVAIPVAPVSVRAYDPLAATPVHGAPQPAQPCIQRPMHAASARAATPIRSRPVNRYARKKSGGGRAIMKIASFALSIVVLVGILGLKALKVGGKQALRQHQAEEREQRRQHGMFGSSRSESVSSSSRSEPGEIQYQLPSSRTGSSTRPNSTATDLSPATPPVVGSGMLFRPRFVTSDGVVEAGTAFAARIDGRQETLVISAIHLFGPAGGLDREIPAALLRSRWKGLSLRDCKSRLLHSEVPMQPIPLTLAKPLPARSAHGDVAVCSVQDLTDVQFRPFPLARERPRAGDRVWLVSEVIGSSSLVHPATVEGIEDGWLLYRFERPIELRATSGAPVVDGKGHVVAVNAGGGDENGVTFGVGTPSANFVGSLPSRR